MILGTVLREVSGNDRESHRCMRGYLLLGVLQRMKCVPCAVLQLPNGSGSRILTMACIAVPACTQILVLHRHTHQGVRG